MMNFFIAVFVVVLIGAIPLIIFIIKMEEKKKKSSNNNIINKTNVSNSNSQTAANIQNATQATSNTTTGAPNTTQVIPVKPAPQKNSTQNNSSKKEHGAGYYFGVFLLLVLGAAILCALAFGGVWLYHFSCEYFHKVPTETTSNNSGQKETTYYFSDYPDGKISRYLDLTHGARWEILGEIGQIVLIDTPNGGDPWKDQHGVNYTRPVTPNGTFTFWADPKHQGALGVRIILP